MREFHNIPYANYVSGLGADTSEGDGATPPTPAHRKHHLDVFAPDDTTRPHPVVFFVHGGGWKRGDRKFSRVLGLYSNVGMGCAEEGFVGVVISYRLSRLPLITLCTHCVIAATGVFLLAHVLLALVFPAPVSSVLAALLAVAVAAAMVLRWLRQDAIQHPEHARDVAQALAWTHANIAQYGGDPTRLFVCGHSAGGHLVSLVTLDRQYCREAGAEDVKIRGVIGISGVYNIEKLDRRGVVARHMFLYPGFGRDREMYVPASPVTHVHDDAPPFLLINAAKDLGLEEHAAELQHLLRMRDVPCKHEVVPGRNHFTIVKNFHRPGDAVRKLVCGFARDVLQRGALAATAADDSFPPAAPSDAEREALIH